MAATDLLTPPRNTPDEYMRRDAEQQRRGFIGPSEFLADTYPHRVVKRRVTRHGPHEVRVGGARWAIPATAKEEAIRSRFVAS
jgi:hypothetical protein